MADRNEPVPETPDGAEPLTDDDAPAPKKSRMFVFILIPLLLVCGAGGGFLAYSQYDKLVQVAHVLGLGGDDDETEEVQPIEYGEFMQIEGVIVNPAGTDGRRFLMVNVGLESNEAAVLEELKTREVVVRDTMLKLLGRRTVQQLASIDERTLLKDELREAVNSVVQEGTVERLYFTQYVLQ